MFIEIYLYKVELQEDVVAVSSINEASKAEVDAKATEPETTDEEIVKNIPVTDQVIQNVCLRTKAF